MVFLKSAPPRHIILSGHSGGYRVMSYILLQGGLPEAIKGVWLFNGLYGQSNPSLFFIVTAFRKSNTT
ncbi:MAG: hypothetical protein KDD02_08400 [Phaeodactylibacter sp.]|nr:hypothetical protein [Phaeodactylibacter sp.]MCB9299860.1 hypothetical protein [Lewinellaceae bacterium]